MRVCLCFMVVEYMRHGMAVNEACAAAIRRIQALPSPAGGTMHAEQLVVGVVAMDKDGNIGGASTLREGREHRGRPFFPVSYWTSDGAEKGSEGDGIQILLAGEQGAIASL